LLQSRLKECHNLFEVGLVSRFRACFYRLLPAIIAYVRLYSPVFGYVRLTGKNRGPWQCFLSNPLIVARVFPLPNTPLGLQSDLFRPVLIRVHLCPSVVKKENPKNENRQAFDHG
jgi:hypothetical protein